MTTRRGVMARIGRRPKVIRGWMMLWRSGPGLDGPYERLQAPWPVASPREKPWFATQRECKARIEENYGYIRRSPDLQKYPHCWLMPIPVRVKVVITRVKERKSCLKNPSTTLRKSRSVSSNMSRSVTCSRKKKTITKKRSPR